MTPNIPISPSLRRMFDDIIANYFEVGNSTICKVDPPDCPFTLTSVEVDCKLPKKKKRRE